MIAEPEQEVLTSIVESLHKELMKGDELVSYLMADNRK